MDKPYRVGSTPTCSPALQESSYRAKPWCGIAEHLEDTCGEPRFTCADEKVYRAEDVERERRSADALLLSFKEELARQRAETFCRCACDGCQDCQETTLEIKDGKLQENVSWKRRAEAAEKKLADLESLYWELDNERKEAEARVRETDTKRGEWARRIETISDMFHDWEISLGSPNDLQRFKEKHSYLDWDSNCEPERFLSSSLRALGEEMRRG